MYSQQQEKQKKERWENGIIGMVLNILLYWKGTKTTLLQTTKDSQFSKTEKCSYILNLFRSPNSVILLPLPITPTLAFTPSSVLKILPPTFATPFHVEPLLPFLRFFCPFPTKSCHLFCFLVVVDS